MASRHSRQKLDLTGQRFGKLTVLRPAENRGGLTAWVCQCDCGQETVALTKRLRDGHCTSCGCDKPLIALTPGGYGRASLTYVDGTCVEMIRANTRRSNNTSGEPGVEWRRDQKTWRASICFKGQRRYLGNYPKFEDAVNARKRAEEELFEPFLREFAETQNQSANG